MGSLSGGLSFFHPIPPWEDRCREARQRAGLTDSPLTVLAFSSVQQALIECVLALSQLYSHKTELALAVDTGPYWGSLGSDAMRLGLRSHLLSTGAMATALNEKKVQAKGLLVSMSCVDDPVVDLLYSQDWLSKVRSEKSFTLQVVHRPELFQARLAELTAYEALIHPTGPTTAVAVLGDRMRVVPFVAPTLMNSGGGTVSSAEVSPVPFPPDEEEALRGDVDAQLLLPRRTRVGDRCCLWWEDLDGSAVIQLLVRRGFPASGGMALSPSAWPLLHKWDWLEQQGLTPQQLRGAVVFNTVGVQWLRNNREAISEVLQEIRRMQG